MGNSITSTPIFKRKSSPDSTIPFSSPSRRVLEERIIFAGTHNTGDCAGRSIWVIRPKSDPACWFWLLLSYIESPSARWTPQFVMYSSIVQTSLATPSPMSTTNASKDFIARAALTRWFWQKAATSPRKILPPTRAKWKDFMNPRLYSISGICKYSAVAVTFKSAIDYEIMLFDFLNSKSTINPNSYCSYKEICHQQRFDLELVLVVFFTITWRFQIRYCTRYDT